VNHLKLASAQIEIASYTFFYNGKMKNKTKKKIKSASQSQ